MANTIEESIFIPSTNFNEYYTKVKELITQQFKILKEWRDEICDGEEWMLVGEKIWRVFPLNFIYTINDLSHSNYRQVSKIYLDEEVIDKLYFPSVETRREFYDFLLDEILDYKSLLSKLTPVCDVENSYNQNWTVVGRDEVVVKWKNH